MGGVKAIGDRGNYYAGIGDDVQGVGTDSVSLQER